MENKKIFLMLNKIVNDNKLRNEFVEKLKHVKFLKNDSKDSDSNSLFEEVWNEFYQFALIVKDGYTMEEFKNLINDILDFNEINKPEKFNVKKKNLDKDDKLGTISGGNSDILSKFFAGKQSFDIGSELGKKLKSEILSIINDINLSSSVSPTDNKKF